MKLNVKYFICTIDFLKSECDELFKEVLKISAIIAPFIETFCKGLVKTTPVPFGRLGLAT